ncbi:helix-turn-helix domain-containing protein [Agrobacterium genomosp. 3]|jgi:MerR family mercuric resistance operon transcriptional regulator|nr:MULTISPECIES: helix-turn-helix domain-containing protein [Hyphomicrobiales]MBU1313853.1 helix-turn-helix domain-containing protein [Alphaproteobacteria bacterium]MCA1868542.1 helix-turn-helix domain-containing protein [Agrobacterium tomkonis]NKC23600.1 helix-turn-helix domain-containing protein [Brucella oryzae]OJU48952.1 MAG: MerR family transcriptional regulator [Mesorhizobium sp. 61-13]CAD6438354.1 MerR family transcriptional regulator [Rhizobium sp. Q54]CAD6631113.1 MerR family transcr
MNSLLSAKGLQRHQLARATGCHLETIRYYEKIGLLPDPPRSASGYRIYDETDVRRLRFILRARELGFGIDEVRGLLHLVDCRSQTCAEVQRRTEPHLAEVRAKIADLQRIEAVLVTMISQCSGEDVPECPILNALAA